MSKWIILLTTLLLFLFIKWTGWFNARLEEMYCQASRYRLAIEPRPLYYVSPKNRDGTWTKNGNSTKLIFRFQIWNCHLLVTSLPLYHLSTRVETKKRREKITSISKISIDSTSKIYHFFSFSSKSYSPKKKSCIFKNKNKIWGKLNQI